jgi:peroxiredoxin
MSRRMSHDRVRSEIFAEFNDEDWSSYRQLVGWLREIGAADGALKVGERAPDFLLPDADGNLVSSVRLREKGPVVLSFYQGGWCPFCTAELRALQEAKSEFEAAGANLAVVSPDTRHFPRQLRKEYGFDLTILGDVDYGVAMAYGVLFAVPEGLLQHYARRGVDIGGRHGSPVTMLPIPATYVIDRRGTIISAFVEPDYALRQDPEEILNALKEAVR